MIMGLDRTYHAHQFIFSFLDSQLHLPIDEAGYPSAFDCTLNTHYRIVLTYEEKRWDYAP